MSDDADKLFWMDDDGPVAGVLLTSWTEENWQCDPVVVAGTSDPAPALVWKRAMEHAASYAPNGFGIPLSDESRTFRELAERDGLAPAGRDSTAWMDAAHRPAVPALPEGFVITDRTHRMSAPHPLRQRSGEAVEHRLNELPLYDPELDLAVETAGGTVAGYSLYWFDPATRVGLVEPVRVEDEFQRRGLARAMLCVGIARLFARGAERVKISYESEAAAALYRGLGFRPTSTATWYQMASNLVDRKPRAFRSAFPDPLVRERIEQLVHRGPERLVGGFK